MTQSVVCFYKPEEENGYLSNWYKSYFKSMGIIFNSGEQYMMYSKARLFKDTDSASQILRVSSPAKIKALGRKVRNFDEDTWCKHRYNIMVYGLYDKFLYNSGLRELLLSTEDKLLAECSVKDKIWGIGLSMNDSRRYKPSQWLGLNLLGKALMDVRFMLNSGARPELWYMEL